MHRFRWLALALLTAACGPPRPLPEAAPAVAPTQRLVEAAPATSAPTAAPENTPAPVSTALSRAPGRLQLIEFYAVT